jgi:hypothetical protein
LLDVQQTWYLAQTNKPTSPAERLLMIESMNLAGRGGRYCDEVSAVRRRRAESGVPVLS